jgi:23S rRNA (cytosine1962-C5)-methyltransferase
LSDDPIFFLLTTHSPGISALTLENMILTHLHQPTPGNIESGEMFIRDVTSGLSLPNGFFSRWSCA